MCACMVMMPILEIRYDAHTLTRPQATVHYTFLPTHALSVTLPSRRRRQRGRQLLSGRGRARVSNLAATLPVWQMCKVGAWLHFALRPVILHFPLRLLRGRKKAQESRSTG